MRRWVFVFILTALIHLLALQPAWAGAPSKTKIILDVWDVAFLEGARAGYIHTQVEERNQDGNLLHLTSAELRLTIKRFKEPIQIGMDTGTIETAGGKVVGTAMRQLLGKGKELLLNGVVKDKMLHLTEDRVRPIKPAPWRDDVVGLFRQMLQFQERNVQPGDTFSFPSFEPIINLVVILQVEVKDFEEIELFGGKEKARLLHVVITPPRIEGVKLSTMHLWLKEDRLPLRAQFEIPGLGNIVLYRTTKANALAPTPVAKLPDIGVSQYVRLKKGVARPHEAASALIRITVKDDDDPATTFSRDERQSVKAVKGNVIDLEVRAAGEKAVNKVPGPEYLGNSYFIACDDEKVKSLARSAVGKETDPWEKALAIEKWVFRAMKVRGHEALATADHVARTLEGDCTEFSMLTAAMCRAEGIPSRTAVGLIYADVHVGPVFAFHMWTEVWIKDRWAPLDATLGRGGIGALHLKITDQSWHEARNMTPLFPVLRVLGRVQIDILSVKY